MIELHDAERGTRLGTITDRQLKFLVDALEEESMEDQDYYISAETIEMLEADGADSDLVGLLRRALGNREGMDIRWSRT
jgi:processive 1,2-diacylglycerol beta-glucosyltransferase